MKTLIISYSMTGNNEALADGLASKLDADHISVTETKTRKISTTAMDMLFNRAPRVIPKADEVKNVENNDLVIFAAPVWMGKVATPLRSYFKKCKSKVGKYAFISISGGADGPNPKLADELKKRMHKEPVAVIDHHIADLLPTDPKPTREDTSAYHLTEKNVKNLTGKIVKRLEKVLQEDV